MRRDSRRAIAVPVVLLAVLVIAVVLVGARAADRRAGTNDAPLQGQVAVIGAHQRACQAPEGIPDDARRLRLAANVEGPVRLRVLVKRAGQTHPGAWVGVTPGHTVLPLPVRLGDDTAATALCLQSAGPGTVVLLGAPTGPQDRMTLSAGQATGRVRIDYLLADRPAAFWTTSLPRLARRIHAATGSRLAPWVALAGLVGALGGGLALVAMSAGAARRREIAVVVVMAVGSGALWAGLMPMLESTDEVAHTAYVQAVAELGHPPRQLHDTGVVSPELTCWATLTRLQTVRFATGQRPPWQPLPGDPCALLSRKADSAQYQAVQPPAFYAMAAAGYKAAELAGGSLPDRLLLARLVSVLLAASSVVAVFLLVRELLPGSPWPARAAALATALQPIAVFNMSMVNSDVLVVAVSSWIALVLARAWRRGPTGRHAVLLGGLYLLGVLAKLNFLVVLPVALGLQALIFLRAGGARLRDGARRIATSVVVAAAGFVLYAAINSAVWDRAVRFQEGNQPGAGVGPRLMVSYVWQTFLPPLGFMTPLWGGRRPPVIDGVLLGWTTRLGHWNDYGILGAWPKILVVFAGVVLVGGLLAATRIRGGTRVAAVVAVATIAYILLVVVSISAPSLATSSRLQPRYVLPLLVVWGLAAGAAIAALPAGWRRAATGTLGVGMAGWTLLAVGATLTRFYL